MDAREAEKMFRKFATDAAQVANHSRKMGGEDEADPKVTMASYITPKTLEKFYKMCPKTPGPPASLLKEVGSRYEQICVGDRVPRSPQKGDDDQDRSTVNVAGAPEKARGVSWDRSFPTSWRERWRCSPA